MLSYIAPLRELRFVLHEVQDATRGLAELPRYVDMDSDILDGGNTRIHMNAELKVSQPAALWTAPNG